MKCFFFNTFLLVITSFFLITTCRESNEDSSIDIAKKIISDSASYHLLVDKMEALIDTSFFAYNRSKSGEYFYNYIVNDSIRGFFEISNQAFAEINPLLRALRVKEIYKYNTENLYRLVPEGKFDKRILILILPNGKNEFIFESKSNLPEASTVEAIEDVLKFDCSMYSVGNMMKIIFF